MRRGPTELHKDPSDRALRTSFCFGFLSLVCINILFEASACSMEFAHLSEVATAYSMWQQRVLGQQKEYFLILGTFVKHYDSCLSVVQSNWVRRPLEIPTLPCRLVN